MYRNQKLAEATRNVARWCANRQHRPTAPYVCAAYLAFKGEVLRQLCMLADSGVHFRALKDDPFPSSAKMREAYDTGNYWVYGKCDMPVGHPLADLIPHNLIDGTRYLQTFNTAFRAIHDYYGHYQTGFTFSEEGEAKAWLAHREMFPRSIARLALVNETIAQSSLFARRRAAGWIVENSYAAQYADIWQGSERKLAKAVKAAVG